MPLKYKYTFILLKKILFTLFGLLFCFNIVIYFNLPTELELFVYYRELNLSKPNKKVLKKLLLSFERVTERFLDLK